MILPAPSASTHPQCFSQGKCDDSSMMLRTHPSFAILHHDHLHSPLRAWQVTGCACYDRCLLPSYIIAWFSLHAYVRVAHLGGDLLLWKTYTKSSIVYVVCMYMRFLYADNTQRDNSVCGCGASWHPGLSAAGRYISPHQMLAGYEIEIRHCPRLGVVYVFARPLAS